MPSDSVSFAPGQTVATVEVLVAGDSQAEFDETFLFSLNTPGSTQTGIDANASGGFGVTQKAYTIVSGGGELRLDYDMYSIPDSAVIFVNGTQIASTGGSVSGTGTLLLPVSSNLQAGDQVLVVMTGSTSGTAWDYSLTYTPGIAEFPGAQATIVNDDGAPPPFDPTTAQDVPQSVLDESAFVSDATDSTSNFFGVLQSFLELDNTASDRIIDAAVRAEIAEFSDPDDWTGFRRAAYLNDLEEAAAAEKFTLSGKTAAAIDQLDAVGKALDVVSATAAAVNQYERNGSIVDAASVAGQKLLTGLITGRIGQIAGVAGVNGTLVVAGLFGVGATAAAPIAIPIGVACAVLASQGSEDFVESKVNLVFDFFRNAAGPNNHMLSSAMAAADASTTTDPFAVGDSVAPDWTFNATTGQFTWINPPSATELGEAEAFLGVPSTTPADLNIVDDTNTEFVFGGTGDDHIQALNRSVTIEGREGADHLVAGSGSDGLHGQAGDDRLEGGGGKDLLMGGDGTDRLYGGAEADLLIGGDGNDLLNGQQGVDFAAGGKGDDRYYVDGQGDKVFEKSNEGDDLVIAYSSYTLASGSSIEAIATRDATGTIAIDLAGNEFVQTIHGNAGVNRLKGGGGGDFLFGLAGGDQLYGETGNDFLTGGAGADYLSGGTGSDTASYATATARVVVQLATPANNQGEAAGDTFNSIEHVIGSAFDDGMVGTVGANRIDGGKGADRIFGIDGDDTLIGGIGADYLSGGVGNDTASYVTAGARVVVQLLTPSNNEGNANGDTFNSIENITGGNFNDGLVGNTGANRLEGGQGDDRIFGVDGNDTLIGGGGADYLSGGTGTDLASYATAKAAVVVSLANPSINKGDAAGDTFNSIENLSGSAYNDLVYGNSANNVINGDAGNDIIKGYAGNDTLTGSAGKDTFVFNTALNASTNTDTITDFSVVDDVIQLDNAFFTTLTTLGTLATAAFRANTTGLAADSSDRIIYETDTGELYYDANGSASGGSVLFAKLGIGLGITAGDFAVI
jgi:Ca2+-binding RTX toxin-like protein